MEYPYQAYSSKLLYCLQILYFPEEGSLVQTRKCVINVSHVLSVLFLLCTNVVLEVDPVLLIIILIKVQYPMYIKTRVQWTYNDIHNNIVNTHCRNINIIQKYKYNKNQFTKYLR